MRVKYNRISSLSQNGNRYSADLDNYDLVLMDRISGTVAFKDRPMGKEVVKLVEQGRLTELVVEEFSRLGRTIGDVISTMEWLEEHNINVNIKNLGLQSRPGGKKNPIWEMMSVILASMYQLELQNIRERTEVGRQIFLQNGGKLGRPKGSSISESDFLKKNTSQIVIKSIRKGLTIREASKVNGVSTRTTMKIKKIALKHGILS